MLANFRWMRNIAVIKTYFIVCNPLALSEQAIGYRGPYIGLSMEKDGYRREERQASPRPAINDSMRASRDRD